MHLFHRFLYRTVISSLIVWTIYLLTIDFYSITLITYQHKQMIHVPFVGNGFDFYTLAITNLVTFLTISCFAFITQFKNIKLISSPIYNIERSKEEIQA